MTLVPAGDERYSPRVGPKVFSDVPSQQEVKEAKQRSAWFFIALVFAVGVAAALGLVVAYYLNQQYPRQDRPGEIAEKIERLEREAVEADQLEAELRRQLNTYGDYARIRDLRMDIEEVRGSIAELLRTTKRGAQDARELRNYFVVYNSGSQWSRDEQLAREHLEDELSRLSDLQRRVRQWNPPVQAPCDPRVC
jgi:hypothetical protein